MKATELPRLLEPAHLAASLGSIDVLIWDLGSDSSYRAGHVPGAVHVPSAAIVHGAPPAPGLLPDESRLNELFARLGLCEERHVVVYDDEGGGWAGRMIWTLEAAGHQQWSYLDGGIHCWRAGGFPLQLEDNKATTGDFRLRLNPAVRACAEDILASLDCEAFVAWDARSREEYEGTSVRAARAGHIPGAVHYEWTRLMDPSRHLCLRPLDELRAELTSLGLGAQRDIVTYCHSHHRSGLTWLVAQLLDYPRIRAYDGSWSDWGNRQDTPVETGAGG